MTKTNDYIYTESQCLQIEGPFTYRQSKWYRSLKKRFSALRKLIFHRVGRLRERIVEYPLVVAAAGSLPSGSRVADIGGASGLLALQLVYLGHEVHVLDLRAYLMHHPRLISQQLDVFDNNLDDNYFDAVSCISVIEHVGIERYGGRSRPDGDFALMREIKRLTQPRGLVLLSAPYGNGHDPACDGKPSGFRIYNRNRLKNLLEGYQTESLRFFVMENGCWLEKDQQTADKTPTCRPIQAIFFAQLRVEKQELPT